MTLWNELALAMTPLEWASAITALVGIWLTVKNRIENWFWCILSVLLYGVFLWKQHLYANAALNLGYFFPCSLYGWWAWAKLGPTRNDDLPVTALTRPALLGWLVASVGFSLFIGYPIAHYTNDPHPYADALTTGFSIAAQFLQARKIYENWSLWIGIDLVYAAYLFPAQKLIVSAVLYGIFTLFAVQGAREWRRIK